MRQVALTTSKGGITRLRTKGAALNDSLYDLVNGYITAARTIKARPGTRRVFELPPGTKGLVSFGGKLHVFATSQVPDIPADMELVVLRSPDGADLALKEIHFAGPFLGALYVAAEFENDETWHFWLQPAPAWEANQSYRSGSMVSPVAGNDGVVFQAGRNGSPYPGWSANTPRTMGDRVEPTIYNGFYYEVVAVTGSNPRSGVAEPVWPTEAGAQVVDSPDVAPGTVVGSAPPAGEPPPPSSGGGGGGGGGIDWDRYMNQVLK